MRHVVTIWGANLQTEEELREFIEPIFDENGDVTPSSFLTATGLNWIDEDFFEVHLLKEPEVRSEFWTYLKEEYAPEGEAFSLQLSDDLKAKLEAYPAVILLYGNESPYGNINEQLFQLTEKGAEQGSPVVLLAKIRYETSER
ncbi:immunity 22 family protein [uncultured Brevibacillus sp.]|uniref:immunity 22 family protein n=1 Tax=uncultured Brevibacillus sp. TaxID=169970 RepID=UPI002596D76D|nr:immunity 22 family protein [uncultured Brevibacillus sp.]